METKKCTKCGFEGDLSNFQLHKSGIHVGKYQAACNKCKAIYGKKYRENKVVKEFDPSIKKICTKCCIEKILTEYSYAKLGKYAKSAVCKKCFSDQSKHKLLTDPDYRKKINDRHKKRYLLSGGLRSKIYYQANKQKWRDSFKKEYNEKYKKDKIYTTKSLLRCRVRQAFKKKSWIKNGGTEKLLGATYEVVVLHIERQFKKGMNWSNRGSGIGQWEIDHRIPFATAKTEDELIMFCHYTNLSPMWAIDNKKKGDKILPIQTTLTI